MKKKKCLPVYIILSLSVIIIISFLIRKKIGNNQVLENSNEVLDYPIAAFHTIEIDPKHLEIEDSMKKQYVFEGIKIREDEGVDFKQAQELLQERIEKEEVCPGGELDITLKFSEEVPTSVVWYNHYYMKEDGTFLYPSLQQVNRLEEVEKSVSIPIGCDLAIALDSSSSNEKKYRMLRIVCQFSDGLREYYVFS